jgi:hypothetical protein
MALTEVFRRGKACTITLVNLWIALTTDIIPETIKKLRCFNIQIAHLCVGFLRDRSIAPLILAALADPE